jgi:hypothetical protein
MLQHRQVLTSSTPYFLLKNLVTKGTALLGQPDRQ